MLRAEYSIYYLQIHYTYIISILNLGVYIIYVYIHIYEFLSTYRDVDHHDWWICLIKFRFVLLRSHTIFPDTAGQSGSPDTAQLFSLDVPRDKETLVNDVGWCGCHFRKPRNTSTMLATCASWTSLMPWCMISASILAFGSWSLSIDRYWMILIYNNIYIYIYIIWWYILILIDRLTLS